jgi:hypothetical protein
MLLKIFYFLKAEILILFSKYGNKLFVYLIVNKSQIEKLKMKCATPMKHNQGSYARKQKR